MSPLHFSLGLWPRLIRLRGRLARFLPFLRKSATLDVHLGEISVVSDVASVVAGHATIPSDAPLAEKVELLMKQVESIYAEIGEERSERAKALEAAHRRIEETGAAVRAELGELSVVFHEVVLDGLRVGLVGGLLVVVGNFALTLGSLVALWN